MSKPFFDLRATHNPHRWYLPLSEDLCVGPPGRAFMFGGVGMAAAIAAMERTCGRPVIWATAQYLSYARPPSVVDLDVRVAVQGRHTSQARVTAQVGDTEILTVNAALGRRPDAGRWQWAQAPEVPAPEACAESERWNPQVPDLHSRIEVRVAHGAHSRRIPGAAPQPIAPSSAHPDGGPPGAGGPDGRLILWIRPRAGEAVDAGMLAIMADHVPSAVGAALGRNAGGNSLDNTIRLLGPAPTAWVLCDTTIVGIAHGVAHGAMRLYSETGVLMATASQSMIVRARDG